MPDKIARNLDRVWTGGDKISIQEFDEDRIKWLDEMGSSRLSGLTGQISWSHKKQ